ncbi:MAG: adenylate/guanylate cyclase domain-containing protein [Pseudomonadota bacterium]
MQKSSCAIMFADISGSTQLYDRLGDEAAKQCIGKCLAHMTAITEAHKGLVIKEIGDELMCRFESADAAVSAAQVSQLEVQSMLLPGGARMSIRAGIHFGDVIEESADIFGDAVNVAARMAGIAKGGQIITTQDTVQQLSASLVSQTRQVDVTKVKGKQDMIAVYEVLWEQNDEVTRMATQLLQRAQVDVEKLELTHGSLQITLDSESSGIVIGRGEDCDLIVDAALASRKHARCEQRRGKFVIVDQSTNGTYVTPTNGNEVYLRREELVLQGNGLIGIGKSLSECNEQEVIKYSC